MLWLKAFVLLKMVLQIILENVLHTWLSHYVCNFQVEEPNESNTEQIIYVFKFKL